MKKSQLVTLVLISSALVSSCRSAYYSSIWQTAPAPTYYPFDPSDISIGGYDAYAYMPDSLGHHHHGSSIHRHGFGHYGARTSS